MKRWLKFRLTSSSLLEVIVSLIILSLVFGFALLIYLNIQKVFFKSDNFETKLEMTIIPLSREKSPSIRSAEMGNDSGASFQFIKTTRFVNQDNVLMEIDIVATNGSNDIIQVKRHLRYVNFEP